MPQPLALVCAMLFAFVLSMKGLHLLMSYLYDNVSPVCCVAACAAFYGISVIIDRKEREQGR